MNMLKRKVTVMLVDDHAVVRMGCRLLLTQSGCIEVVAEAACGEEACQYYQCHHPDVTIMDLNLPGIGGLAALRRIRGRDPSAKVLVFSIHDERVYISRALAAGACGYITKSSMPDRLVEAVLALAHEENYLEPELSQYPTAIPTLDQLSAREFDVFCLRARGLSNREIGKELHISIKTAANYSTLIKDKLKLNSMAELIRLAYQHGIIKEGDQFIP